MRRIVLRIIIALLLGSVATWGVSWSAVINPDITAFFSSPGDFRSPGPHFCGRKSPGGLVLFVWNSTWNMPTERMEAWGGTLYDHGEQTDTLPAWSSLALNLPDVMPHGVVFGEVAAGWPFPALRGEFTETQYTFQRQAIAGVLNGRGDRGSYQYPVFPIIPLWPGFALDTLLFGVMAFVLATLVRIAVVGRRIKHHRCPNCCYDHSGLPRETPCPECGLASRRVRSRAARCRRV